MKSRCHGEDTYHSHDPEKAALASICVFCLAQAGSDQWWSRMGSLVRKVCRGFARLRLRDSGLALGQLDRHPNPRPHHLRPPLPLPHRCSLPSHPDALFSCPFHLHLQPCRDDEPQPDGRPVALAILPTSAWLVWTARTMTCISFQTNRFPANHRPHRPKV